jgi:hypothetical protein
MAAVFFTGCMPKEPVHIEKQIQIQLDEEFVKSVFFSPSHDTIRAVAKIGIEAKNSSSSQRVAAAVRYPSSIRIESLPLFGTANFLFSMYEGIFKFYIPEEEKFYFGSATGKNLYDFFGIYLSPQEITSILTGRPPYVPNRKHRYFGYKTGDEIRIDLGSQKGIIQSVWMGPDRRISHLKVFTEDGTPRFEASFDAFIRGNGKEREYPSRISLLIHMPEPASVKVRYTGMNITSGEGSEFFDLELPEGLSPIHLD